MKCVINSHSLIFPHFSRAEQSDVMRVSRSHCAIFRIVGILGIVEREKYFILKIKSSFFLLIFNEKDFEQSSHTQIFLILIHIFRLVIAAEFVELSIIYCQVVSLS